ncbi:hypothetical protein PBI_ROPE_62 [Mycobacterium phage Rope]|uniref:Uncharacterized protein n=1 Tax=Mycobacterium phage Rope TaxID=2767563 RepID=A0A7G9V0B6_9CAUD|nr:hypothetical protein PBI_ROPE_62 [Mycobacterium phage Rope]
MALPAEEPVIKAMKIAVTAKRNNWHGNIEAPLVDGIRHTTVIATRNDERLEVSYKGNAYEAGEYRIFDRRQNLHCASVALEKVEGWPDILDLFKAFPNKNKPNLVETYRRLPFDEHTDTPEFIMEQMIGRQLFWFSHEYNRLDFDVVLQPRKSNSKNFRIAPVGHRKIFHFMGAKAGFRSVILDTIIKVGNA